MGQKQKSDELAVKAILHSSFSPAVIKKRSLGSHDGDEVVDSRHSGSPALRRPSR
jgi:hypothetical protein